MRRVKLVDRLATLVITLGGLFIIAAVLFIFIFILAEALPLFRSARGEALAPLALPALPPNPTAPAAAAAPAPAGLPPAAAAATGAPALLVSGVDEYQKYAYELLSDGRIVTRSLGDGTVAKSFPLASLGTATITSAFRSTLHQTIVAGTSDGRVLVEQVAFQPRFENEKLADVDAVVTETAVIVVDPAGTAKVGLLGLHEGDEGPTIAAAVAPGTLVLVKPGGEGEPSRVQLSSRAGETFTHVALGAGDALFAATDKGDVYHWDIGAAEPRLLEVRKLSNAPVTALSFSLGEISLLVGDNSGELSSWISVRQSEDDADPSLARSHVYESQGAAITHIASSPRDKSFVTAAADGSLVLRHLTSERTLLRFPGHGQPVTDLLVTPKMDGIITTTAGQLQRYTVSSPHPEVSWRALFGKVWYEGYPRPDYVWQSTGGSDDFEAKFSLIPLVFGTIKGTLYAMLFAVPIAIMGALYTSQFMHPSIRGKVKPTVEIMAALPSVVVGFLAGLWLASRVERSLVPVLLMTVLLPAFGTAGFLLWSRLPHGLARRIKPGMEVMLILPLLLLGALFATYAGPIVESSFFGGDLRLWLNSAMNLVYDQRNALVVGLAMGFAVIPIIFTIAEDSFSSVPSHLTAASLAMGASRWQTATRVVLPTASPGIFSAVMIGFGRAVGETMIVLMATGNTPVLDWSLFNGMRTLSANIAVEIPEAPYGGTLYRVLFLAGLALFMLTFAVNTAAELVRQRLRERYKVI